MSVWLGLPDVDEDMKADDEVSSLFDEADEFDTTIADTETTVKDALKDWDETAKQEEKDEILDNLSIEGADSGMEWKEIIAKYFEAYPDAVGLPRIMAVIEQTMKHQYWFGKLSQSLKVNLKAALEEVSGDIDTIASSINDLKAKLDEIETTLQSERDTAGAPAPAPEGAVDTAAIKGQVQSMKSLQIDSVSNVKVENNRWLVRHYVPGRSGTDSAVPATIIQDLGRHPTRISFTGIFANKPNEGVGDIQTRIELLKYFFKIRKPLFFASTVIDRGDLTRVMLESLEFEETADWQNYVRFYISLVEFHAVDWTLEKESESDYMKQMMEHWIGYQTRRALYNYSYSLENAEPLTLLTLILQLGSVRKAGEGVLDMLKKEVVEEEAVEYEYKIPEAVEAVKNQVIQEIRDAVASALEPLDEIKDTSGGPPGA